MANAIILAHSDNILASGTVGGATPQSGYTANDIISYHPERRVLYSSGTVTITVTISSATGAVAVLPVSNLDASVCTLTNGAGLSVAFPIPTLPANRIPLTAILDFSAQANRTSTTWNLVIVGNSANVVLGGGFAIYSAKTSIDRNYQFGWRDREQHYFIDHANEFGVRLRYDLRTQTRGADYRIPATEAGTTSLRTWYRANHSNPGTFWPDPSVNDAYGLCTWDSFEAERKPQGASDLTRVNVSIAELCKGLPV